MSSPDTITAAPPLPGNWIPSKAGCLNKNDWWIWSWNGGQFDARTVLGVRRRWITVSHRRGSPPEPTPGRNARRTTRRPAQIPEAKRVQLHAVPTFTRPHLDWFRCMSRHGTSGSPTITMTDFQANTQKVIQAKQDPDQHLFAIAMVYQIPPTSSSDASNGLSAAASGGIGVGAGVGVLLIALVAFLLWRRRRSDKTRGKSELPTAASSLPPAGAATAGMTQSVSGYGDQQQPLATNTYGTGDAAYWDARAKHEALQSTPSPVPTGNTIVPGRHEMYSGDTRSELPGYRH
ncbi:hypothetical protein PG984_003086 [Apiospora sp. TS-2023a]